MFLFFKVLNIIRYFGYWYLAKHQVLREVTKEVPDKGKFYIPIIFSVLYP